MIRDVKTAYSKHGLSLNFDKCAVQSNSPNGMNGEVIVDGECIPIVHPTQGFKVLGTQVTLLGRTTVELQARIAAAWGKFHKLWPLIGKRDGPLDKRLKLFDMTVTQTMLWGSESWNLTVVEKCD